MVLFEIHQRFKGYFFNELRVSFKLQKQPSRGVFKKRCSENMQPIYKKTPIPKCDFKKLTCNFIEIARWHGCSPVNLLDIFRTPFPNNTSGQLLVKLDIFKTVKVSITDFPLRFNRHKKVTLGGIFRIHSKI